jgi:hypothetical protein
MAIGSAGIAPRSAGHERHRQSLMANYADLRVIARWQKRKMPETRIRKLAIENYARVLRQAIGSKQA